MSAAATPKRSGLDLAAIAGALRAHVKVAQWQITETASTRAERYLTFLEPESDREAAATRWQIWLALADAEQAQGEASFTLGAGDDQSALRERLETAVVAAASAVNPAFPLPTPGEPGVATPPVQPAALADAAIIADPAAAVDRLCGEYAAAVASCGWVRPSTLEVFVTRSDRRLVNHRGLDLRDRRTRVFVEFVLLHRPDGRDEVEFYDKCESSSLADLRLGERVAHAARCARDGATAAASPSGALPVVIADDYVAELLGYYAHHADASVHARKVNAFALGQPVLARRSGDALDLASDPAVPSLGAYLFDDHGYAPARQELLAQDRLIGLCGAARWMRFLGRQPAGERGTLCLRPGATPYADLLRGDVLEIVRFSEFHPRADTGAFSGEIRLAYWHRADGSRTAVKGGSVTGVLAQALAEARFSRETVTSGCYAGPRAVRFAALTVAG
jgi:predicted Zn-dependent protease